MPAPTPNEAIAAVRERLFEWMVGHASELISLAAEDLERYVYVSPSHEPVLGLTTAELLATSPLDLVHPDDRARFASGVGGGLVGFRLRRADGVWRWMEGHSFHVRWRERPYVASIARDVTELRRAESERARHQQRFEILFQNANDEILVYELTDDGRPSTLVEVNDVACRRLGYSREELLTMSVVDLLDTSAVDVPAALARLRKEGKVVAESTHVARDGRRIPVEVSAHLFDVEGRPTVLAVCRDLRPRQKARRALRSSRRRIRRILESITDGFFTLDEEDRFTFVNRRAVTLLEQSREELLDRVVWDVFPEAHDLAFHDALRRAQREGAHVEFEAFLPSLGKWFGASVYPFEGGAAIYFRDVTERRWLEREVTRVAEAERHRIGQDLHDGLGAHLTGLAMMSQGLAETIRSGRSVPPERLEYLAQLASDGAEQARALARGLNPVSLDERGLETALRELSGYAWTTAGVKYSLDFGGDVPALDNDVENQLYWIVHEAVTNVLRHAGATRVRVRVRRQDDRIELTVDDDGRGPSGEDEQAGGTGLRIMQHRAHRLGARFRYKRGPLGGVRIRCELSLTHPSAVPSEE